MESVHYAARYGELGTLTALVGEDATLLNAPVKKGVGTGPRGQTFKGCTPLMLAAYGGHIPDVDWLLAVGADVALRDCEGWTALHWAVAGERASAVSLLIDGGALAAGDPRHNYGETPLLVAADLGAVHCVRVLLSRGGDAVDIDATDRLGRTALHRAAASKNRAVVRLLVRAGADPSIPDRYGATAIDACGPAESAALLEATDAAAEESAQSALGLGTRLLGTARAVVRATRAFMSV